MGDQRENVEAAGEGTGSLAKRLLASFVFIPCLLIIAHRGGLYYLILIDMVIMIGMWEFYKMMEAKGLNPYKVIGIVSGIALSWYVFFQQGIYANFLLSLIFMGIMILELVRSEKGLAVYHISVTIFGVFYVAWLGSHLILLRELPYLKGLDYSVGFSFVLLVFTLTWCYDTGAFTVGRLIGRTKLFPRISPGKTMEGAIGGILFAIAGILILRTLNAHYLSVTEAVSLAVIASIFGQLGDLVESMLKRDVKIKDSSRAIPGHGGILDRFDSLLFTAPLLYYLMKYFILG
ncbi:MAG: phosphatidate cytidylyltransferase [Candidatus Krumholzibacteriota bacterium]|nr:phosphatidate cytidylyltransferase [Candidatus Krumholzibacteriota bacterium]